MKLEHVLLSVICVLVLIYVLNHYFRFIGPKKIEGFETSIMGEVSNNDNDQICAKTKDNKDVCFDEKGINILKTNYGWNTLQNSNNTWTNSEITKELVKLYNYETWRNADNEHDWKSIFPSLEPTGEPTGAPRQITTLPPVAAPIVTTGAPLELTQVQGTTGAPLEQAVQQASITTGTGTKNISITLGDNIRNVLEKLIVSQSSLKPGDCTAESQFN
jgi:hypothetical protein